MRNMNSFYLQGRIAQNAEYTTTDSGTPVARFAVAVNRDYLDSNKQWVKNVSFFPIVLFGHYAKKYEGLYLKGKEILLEGHLKQTHWESNGEKHSATQLAVDWLTLPGEKPADSENKEGRGACLVDPADSIPPEYDEPPDMYENESIDCEEIPF